MAKKKPLKSNDDDSKSKKLIGLRISNEIINQLKEIGTIQNETPNQIAVLAIKDYVQKFKFIDKLPYMIVPKNLIVKILEIADEPQLEIITNLLTESMEEMFIHIIKTPLSHITLKNFYPILPKILKNLGLKWFDSLEFHFDENYNIYGLKGIHFLGLGFSKLFSQMINNIMKKYFNHELIESSIKLKENSIYIEFKSCE